MAETLEKKKQKKKKLVNPVEVARNRQVARLRLQGLTLDEIAKKVDVTPATVSRVLSRDDIKARLEAGMQRMVDMVPRVTDNYSEFLDDVDKNLRLAASRDVLKVVGLMPGQTSNFITNITENNTQNIMMSVDPRAAAALHAALQAAMLPGALPGASGGDQVDNCIDVGDQAVDNDDAFSLP